MSDTYEINAKLTADDSGFQAAFSRMDASLNQWGLNLNAMYSKGASFFKGFGVDVDQFASKLGSTGPMLAGWAGAAIIGFTTLKNVISATTKEWAEDEVAQLRFNAAIKSNSTMMAGAEQRLNALAEKFGMLTGNTNSSMQSMIAMLAATGRTESEITKMMQAAEGLSLATGTDLNTALTQLNQTFSGTTGRLGRTTPELNNLTKEELANGAAVDVLITKYGSLSGVLEHSTTVSINNLNNQWGEMKSALGEMFEQTLRPMREMLTSIITFLLSKKELLVGMINGLIILVGALGVAIGIATGGIVPIIGAIIAGITALMGVIFELVHVFGKQKQAADDAKVSVQSYADSIKGLTTAQLENQRASLLLRMQEIGESSRQFEALRKQLETVDALIAARKKETDLAARDEARTNAINEYNQALQDATRLQQAGLASLEDTLKAKQSATQTYLETLAKLGLANSEAFKTARASLVEYGDQLSKLGYTPGMVETPEEEKARYESGRHGTTPGGLEYGATSGMGYGTEGTGFNASQYGGFSKLQEALTKIANTMSSTTGAALGKSATSAEGEAGKLFSSIAQYGPVIGSVMYSLSTVFETMFKILQPMIDTLLKPLLEVFQTIGVILADALAPAFAILTPIIQLVAKALGWLADKVMIPVANFIINIWNGIANTLNAVLGWAGVHLNTVPVITTEGVQAQVVGMNSSGSSGQSQYGSYSASYLGYASGTEYATGGYAMVGERGPEMMYVPQGAKVSNAKETAQGVGKSVNIVNNFYSPKALNEAEMVRRQKENQRQLAFSGAI